eukprot:c45838_g1_i1 orf=5-175(-)
MTNWFFSHHFIIRWSLSNSPLVTNAIVLRIPPKHIREKLSPSANLKSLDLTVILIL